MKQDEQPETRPERSRGRPLETRQLNLRTHILDGAEQLFTDHGFAGTSIRSVAGSAGVNPALVHYYFGNKRALLTAVLVRSLQPLVEAIAAMKDNVDVSIQDIALLLITMAAEQPNMPLLLTREVLLPGGEMQDYFRENLAPHLGGALPALLERQQAGGRIRHDADPAISALMILAICVFPFIAQSLAEPVLGIEFDSNGIEKLTSNVLELLNRGVTK